jgi:glycosyltransferase involved in cell wall biosynthesis
MCFLDRETCEEYRQILSQKYFTYLPDITNVDLPDHSFPLAETVLQRAGGRRIVFLGGSIGGQKNIENWCRLIAMADPRRWFFIQIGEIHTNTLSAQDVSAYQQLAAHLPDNVLLHEAYLPDEREFNALTDRSDVIFAVYRNFRISSNMLVKAAYLEKPILVSDKHLLGERVRRYGIGLGVPEDDPDAMLTGLEQLAAAPIPADRFAAFRADFSLEAMSDRLHGFFERVLQAEPLPFQTS